MKPCAWRVVNNEFSVDLRGDGKPQGEMLVGGMSQTAQSTPLKRRASLQEEKACSDALVQLSQCATLPREVRTYAMGPSSRTLSSKQNFEGRFHIQK